MELQRDNERLSLQEHIDIESVGGNQTSVDAYSSKSVSVLAFAFFFWYYR